MIRRVLGRAVELLLGQPLLAVFAGLQGAMMLLIVGAYLATRHAPAAGEDLGTGDFLAFWTGAVLVHDGRGALLSDFDAQLQLQSEILGAPLEIFQPYLNPPLLAVVLSVTVPLGYLASFYLFGLATLVAFCAAMALLMGELGPIASRGIDRFTTLALIAGYQPIARMMFGGQNTVLTLSLLAVLYVAVRRGWWPVAAVMLGLLTYKPQYAIGLGLALLALGELRVVAGGALGGLAHWAIGALVCGPEWPLRMLDAMAAHAPREVAENGDSHFAWVRATGYALPEGLAGPVGALGAAAALAAILGLGWACRQGRVPPAVYWAFAISATMFASPHLQYYDAGLLALPVVLLVDHAVGREGALALPTRGLLALGYLGYGAHEYAPQLGFQPLAGMLAAVLGWAVYRAVAHEPAPAVAAGQPHGG